MFFTTSPAYTIFIRLKLRNRSGIMSRIISTIRRLGGEVRGVALVDTSREWFIRDVHVNVVDGAQAKRIVDELSDMEGVMVESISDRTFMAHLGGKIEVVSKRKISTSEDLTRIYTPGVGRVVEAIRSFPDTVFTHTIKSNTVAIVTDGSAVLGFGNVGSLAAIPVMEGKAAILKEFGGVNGFPICLATQDPDEIVDIVKKISPVFGAVNLEDISAPRCFEIERRLQDELDIPVMHDDQHATAVAVLAALINALRIVGRNLFDIKVVINGIGAAGYATAKLLLKVGVRNIILCDKKGAIGKNGENSLNDYQREIAQY
ncbi:MAG: NAD-dependent malic enzyme, partial [Brevinematales bacterium]